MNGANKRFMSQHTCVDSCPPGEAANLTSSICQTACSSVSCSFCDSSNLFCRSKSDCLLGYYFFNGECVSRCPSHTKDNGIN
jgi:hypothetical protein